MPTHNLLIYLIFEKELNQILSHANFFRQRANCGSQTWNKTTRQQLWRSNAQFSKKKTKKNQSINHSTWQTQQAFQLRLDLHHANRKQRWLQLRVCVRLIVYASPTINTSSSSSSSLRARTCMARNADAKRCCSADSELIACMSRDKQITWNFQSHHIHSNIQFKLLTSRNCFADGIVVVNNGMNTSALFSTTMLHQVAYINTHTRTHTPTHFK